MEVELRFTIEVSPAEWRALRYVMDGATDAQIAARMHLSPLAVARNFSEWRLDLNLIDATRENLVEWRFIPPMATPEPILEVRA